MENNLPIPENLSPSASRLLSSLNRIRIMLWAGDFDRARSEITQLNLEQGEIIAGALEIRTEVMRSEREFKKEARANPEYLQLHFEGFPISPKSTNKQKETLIAAEAAKKTREIIIENETLFVISPIASILSKLDNRISEVRGEKPIFQIQAPSRSERHEQESNEQPTTLPVVEILQDQETGFRYIQIEKDDQHWECRAYRFNAIRTNIEKIRENFNKILDVNLEFFDHGEVSDQPTWPYRFRGFSRKAFIEVTVYNPNRVMVEITADQQFDHREYLKEIFAAL